MHVRQGVQIDIFGFFPSDACSHDRMEDNVDNSPNLESASSKCMHNKKLSNIPFVPSFSGTNYTKIEVHPRVRRQRHLDIEVSIDKIFNLVSDKVVDMGENDEASDEDVGELCN